MLRFPIRWEMTEDDSKKSQYTSKLRLNDKWEVEIVCISKNIEYDRNLDQSIKICREVTSEELLVTGTLSLERYGKAVSTQEFSKLMKPGSSFILTNFSHAHRNFGEPKLVYYLPIYSLSGVVYVAYSQDFHPYIQPKSLVQLSNDLGRLLDPQTSYLADVTLKCGSTSIPAHKLILSARSPVFAAMFSNPMKENHENQVDIADVDASVLRAVVIYIYTGKTPNLTVSSASKLLFTADKYQLLDLKRVCCDFLKKNVSVQNILRILILGDMHAEDMKSFALDYICNQFPQFSVLENTEEWKTLRKERPALAMDVLTSLVKSRDQKSNDTHPRNPVQEAAHQCFDIFKKMEHRKFGNNKF
ncbi:TD and POZ domain-containing protein 3 [Araneus ventricosus]|uniref:TD and POZ domain-containing protein 3 n=1 Tax=Araneus ventricosus TaxID=182803 RepID=A0A4Y2VAW4_ARAVE|nr:TD and POZ domain-containing protein 3 [Araneus ventricosus]